MSSMSQRFILAAPLRAAVRCLLAAAVANLCQPAWVGLGSSGEASAQAVCADARFTVKGVRPEAFSWLWDNADVALLTAANSSIQAFEWLQAPSSPQHLGYSSGARYRSVEVFGGRPHTLEVAYLPPDTMRGRVASDNFLGSKPYSFVAQSVSIDGRPPFTLLAQYTPAGRTFSDSLFQVQISNAADPALAQAYVLQLQKTWMGLAPTLTAALNARYFNAVLKKRGFYTVGKIDNHLNVKLTVSQEIKGIDTQMLAWWWDHIGNTARYRLWQPIDHVSFEWTVAPNSPDLQYDVGAVQKAKEYIGRFALTLNITGADPATQPPPDPITEPDYFYARTDLTLLAGILPSNSLVHQWRPNATGDGVILSSTFVNTALALVINPTFFDDLGSHALREFQMLPYFLPRLYRREYLHE